MWLTSGWVTISVSRWLDSTHRVFNLLWSHRERISTSVTAHGAWRSTVPMLTHGARMRKMSKSNRKPPSFEIRQKFIFLPVTTTFSLIKDIDPLRNWVKYQCRATSRLCCMACYIRQKVHFVLNCEPGRLTSGWVTTSVSRRLDSTHRVSNLLWRHLERLRTSETAHGAWRSTVPMLRHGARMRKMSKSNRKPPSFEIRQKFIFLPITTTFSVIKDICQLHNGAKYQCRATSGLRCRRRQCCLKVRFVLSRQQTHYKIKKILAKISICNLTQNGLKRAENTKLGIPKSGRT